MDEPAVWTSTRRIRDVVPRLSGDDFFLILRPQRLWSAKVSRSVIQSEVTVRIVCAPRHRSDTDKRLEPSKRTPGSATRVDARPQPYHEWAQVLTAATFPEQVVDTDQWRQPQSYASPYQIAAGADRQTWDPSVKR